MKTIFKYRLEITDEQELMLPKDAEILTIRMQEEVMQLWALVDTVAELETRKFRIAGTGHSIDCGKDQYYTYIATVEMGEVGFIWHVFELCEIDHERY